MSLLSVAFDTGQESTSGMHASTSATTAAGGSETLLARYLQATARPSRCSTSAIGRVSTVFSAAWPDRPNWPTRFTRNPAQPDPQRGQPQGRASFRTWLYQIARNRLIDHWRKHGQRQPLQDSYDEQLHAQPDQGAGPEQQLSLSRDGERLQSALETLPEEQREVFLMRAHGELELAEIATLTQSPLETVKSRFRYAVQKLRRLLAEEVAV